MIKIRTGEKLEHTSNTVALSKQKINQSKPADQKKIASLKAHQCYYMMTDVEVFRPINNFAVVGEWSSTSAYHQRATKLFDSPFQREL